MDPSPDAASSPRHGTPLRLGLVQLRPRKAEVETNLAAIRERIAASGGDHDLLVFPETALSGYFLEGGVSEAARTVSELVEGLGAPPAEAPDVVVGFYERWRHRVHNSVAHLAPRGDRWEAVHVHRKLFLPTYGVFDEARFVDTGRDVGAYDTRFGRMGLLICEELWHALTPAILALDGAELLLVVSASPGRDFRPDTSPPGNLERWERLMRSAAEEHGVFVATCQLVGSEGGKLFPGGSTVVAPDGTVLARGPVFEEGVVSAALDPTHLERARFDSPLLADLEQMLPHLRRSLDRAVEGAGRAGDGGGFRDGAVSGPVSLGGRPGDDAPTPGPVSPDPSVLALDMAQVEAALVRFIHEEVVVRRGFRRVVVGVSGGVDSAVSLHLAVRALGKENVHGFRLPASVSSPESLAHAEVVLEATGARSRTLDISDVVEAYVQAHEPDISPERRGNLMARVRGLILFDQSARLGALPLGTGNKSERLLGYYTWHADDSPPINPLGDLFKTQVWELARHLGIPDEIVEKPASADLVKGVDDEDELGIGYHRADPILHWLVRGYTPDDLVRYGFDPEEVELVSRRVESTHWKRELPTVAMISSTAIGEFYLRPVDY